MVSFLKAVETVNGAVKDFVWGAPTILLIIGAGAYFTVRTRFFQIAKIGHVFRETIFAVLRKKRDTNEIPGDGKSMTQLQAITTALAATIGTGNIVGVATAITAGGPGAVFWMWISALLGMMTMYAENVLGICFRRKTESGEWAGGPMYYIEEGLSRKKGLSRLAKPLSMAFSLFCVLASFGIGNMTQANSISAALLDTFNIPAAVTGVAVALLTQAVIFGGIKRIGAVCEKVVPFMALAYCAAAVIIIAKNADALPGVFSMIVRSAFGIEAVAGGVSGIIMKQAVSTGVRRGVFSNEAGLGTSVIVNCASDVEEPVVQGMWGIFQVFADTIVICTLTALALLSAGATDSGGFTKNGAALVSSAFSGTFGGAGSAIIAVSILFFAFATLIGWSFIGARAAEHLWGGRAVTAYKTAFILFIVIGSVLELTLVWDISDTLNGLMALPNLAGVILLSGTVVGVTRDYVRRNLSRGGRGRGGAFETSSTSAAGPPAHD